MTLPLQRGNYTVPTRPVLLAPVKPPKLGEVTVTVPGHLISERPANTRQQAPAAGMGCETRLRSHSSAVGSGRAGVVSCNPTGRYWIREAVRRRPPVQRAAAASPTNDKQLCVSLPLSDAFTRPLLLRHGLAETGTSPTEMHGMMLVD